ncbi:hemerythrin domain-containing protein [Rhodopila sp.]|uniref:hemerythrin domain-containing protein n=1 Tax=Rhodopila sp. TaxID=2480087 RepID=UPI003D141A70
MSLRTLMQAGPAKANELFARLSDTSDGAVKTREKLFAELRAELELHAGLEEQHLFPVLRRNPETKELVTDAIKDNKALRTKLAELDALPKNDETFSERLKELQRAFRQHARDEKRELLPAVQRALSEEQVQSVTDKIEAGVVEAERARHDEVEARRTKARQEREEAEHHAEQQEAAEQARQAAAEHARQAKQEAAAKRVQVETEARLQTIAKTVGQTATAAQTGVLRTAENAAMGAQRVGTELHDVASTYSNSVQSMAPDLRAVAALPGVAVGAMTEIRSAWIEWIGQTARASTQMSQDLLGQVAEQQRRFAAATVHGWMEHNARVMQVTRNLAQAGFNPFINRSTNGSTKRGNDQ